MRSVVAQGYLCSPAVPPLNFSFMQLKFPLIFLWPFRKETRDMQQ
jgi:hypothetical protein